MSTYYPAKPSGPVRSTPLPPRAPPRPPAPPEPNKRRLQGELAALDPKTGKGLIASSAGEFSFHLNSSLTVNDRKQISSWAQGILRINVDFSVVLGDSGDEVGEIVVSSVEPILPMKDGTSLVSVQSVPSTAASSTASSARGSLHSLSEAASPSNLAPMLADQDDLALLEIDRLLLTRTDCDDPSLTRHPPMFQLFWELNEFMKTPRQARTVPVILVRSRLTVNTAIMVILSEKTAVGMDVVCLEEGLILLSVCTGAAVFVFDLPKMHPPERDSVALWLLSTATMRPQVPIVSLSVLSMKKLATTYPESFFACKPLTVGAIDVLQAAQQVLPEISKKARSAEELINMVFGYKHAPRPTRSEDAALSIAFGRPAFHSRQVFAQLNNLARNQSFAALLDQQAVARSDYLADDASPSSSCGTTIVYKRRRLGSASAAAGVDAVYNRGISDEVIVDDSKDEEELNAGLFMEWIKGEIQKPDS